MTLMVTKVPRIASVSTKGQGVDMLPINRTYMFFHKITTALACRRRMGLSRCNDLDSAGARGI